MIVRPSRFELRYAALLTYSPSGVSKVSLASQRVVMDLKQDRVVNVPPLGDLPMPAYFAFRLHEQLASTPFAAWFDDALLVPTPRSAPLQARALWPAERIASEMALANVGAGVLRCPERVRAVPKSAFSQRGERPGPEEHRDSLKVSGRLPPQARKLVQVDDVVTRGATLLGAGQRLREAFPGVEIVAFAAVRTRGLVPEIESILDPCVGTIRADGAACIREP